MPPSETNEPKSGFRLVLVTLGCLLVCAAAALILMLVLSPVLL